MKDPTDLVLIQNLLESAKRHCKPKTVKKEIISSSDIKLLCSLHVEATDICIVRDLCMITLARQNSGAAQAFIFLSFIIPQRISAFI